MVYIWDAMMSLTASTLRQLTRIERMALLAGAFLVATFLLTYFGYLLIGHSVLQALYQHGITTRNVDDLQDWLARGDRAFDYFLGRRLLLTAGLGALLSGWSFRRSAVFADIRSFWHCSAGAPRVVLIGLFGLLIAGHYVDRNRELFPFVRWGMYTGVYEPSEMAMFDLYAITAGGERHLVNIGRTLPSIHRGAPRAFSEYAVRPEDDDAGEDRQPASVQNLTSLDRTAVAVARLYAETLGEPLVAAEIVREVVLRDAPGRYRRNSQVIRRIDVAPPQSGSNGGTSE